MGATAYPDSSFLVSLACHDGKSAEAGAHMARSPEVLMFTPLHRIEARSLALKQPLAQHKADAQAGDL